MIKKPSWAVRNVPFEDGIREITQISFGIISGASHVASVNGTWASSLPAFNVRTLEENLLNLKQLPPMLVRGACWNAFSDRKSNLRFPRYSMLTRKVKLTKVIKLNVFATLTCWAYVDRSEIYFPCEIHSSNDNIQQGKLLDHKSSIVTRDTSRVECAD